MHFQRVTQSEIDSIQLGAGVLLKSFVPSSWSFDDDAIICATTGGVKASCIPDYEDLGEDIYGVKPDCMELRRITGWECTLEFTAVSADQETLAMALGPHKTKGSKVSPSPAVSDDDYIEEIWWVGDKLDGGFLAIQLANVLPTDGFTLSTSQTGAGEISCSLTGHTDAGDVPMLFYVGEAQEDTDTEAGDGQDNSGPWNEVEEPEVGQVICLYTDDDGEALTTDTLITMGDYFGSYASLVYFTDEGDLDGTEQVLGYISEEETDYVVVQLLEGIEDESAVGLYVVAYTGNDFYAKLVEEGLCEVLYYVTLADEDFDGNKRNPYGKGYDTTTQYATVVLDSNGDEVTFDSSGTFTLVKVGENGDFDITNIDEEVDLTSTGEVSSFYVQYILKSGSDFEAEVLEAEGTTMDEILGNLGFENDGSYCLSSQYWILELLVFTGAYETFPTDVLNADDKTEAYNITGENLLGSYDPGYLIT